MSVVGRVEAGQAIIPSGRNDGTAIAVPILECSAYVAVALEASDEPGIKMVQALVANFQSAGKFLLCFWCLFA